MSGPPYPRFAKGAGPGQNGIGSFVIGSSPIGIIPTFDPWIPIISQYKNSPAIDAQILAFNAAMDQTNNIQNLWQLVWNINTAQGYGLQVLGRIVGVNNTIEFPSGAALPFGFEEPESWVGFGQGGFYSGGGTTVNFTLSDTDFRTLVKAKAASNICNGSIPAMNNILMTLFPNRGNAFIINNQNMSIVYNFEFQLNVVEQAILSQSGVLPEFTGIATSIVSV
jgi:hypothetical protein